MRTLTVELAERSYPIHIGSDLITQPGLMTPFLKSRRVAVVTNDVVGQLTEDNQRAVDRLNHIQIAIASQSARLARREANLQAEVSGLIWLPLEPTVDVARYVDGLHGIAAAVAAENPDEARRLAEAHIMGQLARLTQVNLDLSAGAAAS